MRALDLFSGIGGFSLGLERAGFETVAFCEINPYCRQVLKQRFPGVYCHDDIKTLKYGRFGKDPDDWMLYDDEADHEIARGAIDIVSGGFPCQDIAICGTGRGLDGEKSSLWFEMLRLLGEIRPRFVIVENSPELLDNGSMRRILGGLSEIGYDAEWHVIPAAAFGAAHLRERLYVLAYPGGAGCEECYLSTITGEAAQWEHTHETGADGFFWPKTEPPILRIGDDVPHRVDRIKALGNTVVPTITQWIGERIQAVSGDG